jgi:U3 small nucleolar RNA-associated protein 10
MEQALQQLQRLNEQELRASDGARAAKAARAAAQALYDLFKALEGLMGCGSYLTATLRLALHMVDKVRRRALKLFAERLASLQASLASEAGLPSRQREARLAEASGPALHLCVLLPFLLARAAGGEGAAAAGGASALARQVEASDPKMQLSALLPDALARVPGGEGASALTRQAALLALDGVARMFGRAQPRPVLAALPWVLVAAADEGSAAVRASALACAAAVVKALGPQLVPLLPATAEAVLAAAERAQQRLAPGRAAAAAGEEEGAERASAAEEAALELSSALAAVDALVRSMGAFCSPYLPRILRALMRPEVLSCTAAGCDAFAGGIRSALPLAVPARLLLQPLFGQWEHAEAAAAAPGSSTVAPAVALLGMVAATASAMDAQAAAAYHEQLFAFLLRALDARQRRLLPGGAGAAGSGALAQLEGAAVAALVALVMKLSEARFKPLFLRLLEWAAAPGPGVAGVGRVAALLACADALTARLRAVFVPYFKYLLEVCVQQLAGGAEAQQPKKRRKKAAAEAAAEGPEAGDEEALLGCWLARLRALRALHRCLQHDTVAFLDRERFDRLLPALVAQLGEEPPARLLPILQAQCADADLDASVKLGSRSGLDVLGTAAVACITQLAVSANSDALWKPLNHQVLMATRSPRAASRLAGLEVVAQLVRQLHEEYLMLLPETIPFLAELVEDSEQAVEARAQEVVKMLEEVSGESLAQYMK